ncbi:MAG: class II aldolase/adducin family protein [Proteobacteria bacterium]|nr:class II aldolase/adducin family protein [Pseudomonadota bacterium]
MEFLVDKYADKLRRAGLCENPVVGGLDDVLVWNRGADPAWTARLTPVFGRMNISGLVFGCPAEPFATILEFLAAEYPDGFAPKDTETRTFLHELPVIHEFTPKAVADVLGRRKSVIIATPSVMGIAAHGSVTPEQGFVTFSSVCFSSFVLFFSEYLRHVRAGTVSPARRTAFEAAVAHLEPMVEQGPELACGPFADREAALQAMVEAGRATVEYRLVDSYFGNISCLLNQELLISQTGSSLDELPGLIDFCPLDGSSTACLTASSELTAHSQVYAKAGGRAILHGHPRFTVILSMDCAERGQNVTCEIGKLDLCHVKCPAKRYLSGEDGGVPIVPGEVGTGPNGLANTLPAAMTGRGAAAVWGHGLFTLGNTDFNQPFQALLDIENGCRRRYFAAVDAAEGRR